MYFLKNLTADYTNWTDLKEFRIHIKSPPLPIIPRSNYRSDHITASINTNMSPFIFHYEALNRLLVHDRRRCEFHIMCDVRGIYMYLLSNYILKYGRLLANKLYYYRNSERENTNLTLFHLMLLKCASHLG